MSAGTPSPSSTLAEQGQVLEGGRKRTRLRDWPFLGLVDCANQRPKRCSQLEPPLGWASSLKAVVCWGGWRGGRAGLRADVGLHLGGGGSRGALGSLLNLLQGLSSGCIQIPTEPVLSRQRQAASEAQKQGQVAGAPFLERRGAAQGVEGETGRAGGKRGPEAPGVWRQRGDPPTVPKALLA